MHATSPYKVSNSQTRYIDWKNIEELMNQPYQKLRNSHQI